MALSKEQGLLLRIFRTRRNAFSPNPGRTERAFKLCAQLRERWKVDLYFLEREYADTYHNTKQSFTYVKITTQ